jgi:hypothetical protein
MSGHRWTTSVPQQQFSPRFPGGDHMDWAVLPRARLGTDFGLG